MVHTHAGEHHAHVHAHVERTVGCLLSLGLLLLLDLLGVLLHTLDLVAEVAHELDEVWHDVLLKAAPPADLHGDVGLDELIAVVEHGTNKLLILPRHDEPEEVLSQGRVLRLSDGLHGVLVEVILLGELDRLLVLLHLAVEKCGDAAALEKLVVLKTDGQVDRLEGVVLMDTLAELLEVLVLKVDLVEGLVDSADVLALNTFEELGDESDVASALEGGNSAGKVELLAEELEKIVEKHGLLLEVEQDRLVEKVVVSDVDDVLAESIVLPGSGRVLDHSDDSLVLLVIDTVEEDSLSPHLVAFTLADEPGDHELLVVGAHEVHETVPAVLGVHDTQVGVDALMGALKVHAGLEEGNKLVDISELFVEGDELLKMVRVDDDVLTTESSHVELLCANASEADRFPDARDVSLAGCLERKLILLQLNVDLGEFLVVVNALVQDLSSQVELVIEAAVSTLFTVSLVGLANEGLKVSEPALATLGVSEDELVIDTLVLELSAGHQEILDNLLRLVLLSRELDDSLEFRSVVSLDEGIDRRADCPLTKLGLTELRPSLWLVSLLGELGGLPDIVELVEDDLDGINWLVALLVDAEGLVVELVLVVKSHLSELITVVVVESDDVVHDSGGIGTDGGQDKEVLQ